MTNFLIAINYWVEAELVNLVWPRLENKKQQQQQQEEKLAVDHKMPTKVSGTVLVKRIYYLASVVTCYFHQSRNYLTKLNYYTVV